MINPRVEKVKAIKDFKLLIVFTNSEEKVFDMKPYLDKGVFKALNEIDLFNKAHVAWGTVVWNEDLDMSPDTLYLDSKSVSELSFPPSNLTYV
jgi:hypothetical protein